MSTYAKLPRFGHPGTPTSFWATVAIGHSGGVQSISSDHRAGVGCGESQLRRSRRRWGPGGGLEGRIAVRREHNQLLVRTRCKRWSRINLRPRARAGNHLAVRLARSWPRGKRLAVRLARSWTYASTATNRGNDDRSPYLCFPSFDVENYKWETSTSEFS